jgi:hypothetical protein
LTSWQVWHKILATERGNYLFEEAAVEELGYLIVEKQEILMDKYLNDEKSVGGYNEAQMRALLEARAEYQEKLRQTFPSIMPEAYRGVYREPLEGGTIDQVDLYPGWGGSTRQARLKMAQVLAYKFEESFKWVDYFEDENTFLRFEDAQSVYNLLGNPNDFEIILIRRHNFQSSPNTLGFDIGYWGGDNYSIICDTFVRPQWHSAPKEEIHNLAPFASKLNRNVLFDNFERAQEFLTYYRTTSWGEPDDSFDPELGTSDYTIIQVDGVVL